MKIYLSLLPVLFLLLIVGFTSCQKGIGNREDLPTIDSTITDTTIHRYYLKRGPYF